MERLRSLASDILYWGLITAAVLMLYSVFWWAGPLAFCFIYRDRYSDDKNDNDEISVPKGVTWLASFAVFLFGAIFFVIEIGVAIAALWHEWGPLLNALRIHAFGAVGVAVWLFIWHMHEKNFGQTNVRYSRP